MAEQSSQRDEEEPFDGPVRPSPIDSLAYVVIGAAQKVHRVLGPGFTENIYQAALERELVQRKIPFESQKELQVFYEGYLCGMYRADMLVYGRLILELKAVAQLAKEHKAQTKSYMKASGLPAALLLNFGATSLEVWRLNQSESMKSAES